MDICLASRAVEIAEHDTYLEITNRLCYYDDENLNKVELPYKNYEEVAKACAQTLVNMPVQAKYKVVNGLDDLGSHEMIKTQNGIVFGTTSVGTHTEAWIVESESVTTVNNEVKDLPVLYAKARIWKRNPKLINAIKRLFDSDKGLGSSWEIHTIAYEYKNNVKTLTEYEFLANCLLGSNVTPAYNGTSMTVEMSSVDEDELMIAEALTQDLFDNKAFEDENTKEMEVNILEKEQLGTNEEVTVSEDTMVEEPIVEEPTVDEGTEEPTVDNSTSEGDEANDDSDDSDDTETSAMTTYDLRLAIQKACAEKCGKEWVYVDFIFPEEHIVLCDFNKRERELQYLKFTYEVIDGESVTVSDPEIIELVISPLEINTVVGSYDKTIEEKDALIASASEKITALEAQVAELTQYKEKFDAVEQEKIAAELAAKKEELVSSIVKTGQITKEELESDEELSAYVEKLDKKSLMSIVGERLLSSMNKEPEVQTVETSEVSSPAVSSSLYNTDDEPTARQKMRTFLGL